MTRLLLMAITVNITLAAMAANKIDMSSIRQQQASLWEAAKERTLANDLDSALVLTRRLLNLTDENQWDSIPFMARKLRGEIRAMQKEYDWAIYIEYAYFDNYPADGPFKAQAESMKKRLWPVYEEVVSKRLNDEISPGVYISEIHDSKNEIQNKFKIGEKHHAELPFLAFLILEKDGHLVAKMSPVCGASKDLKAFNVMSGEYNEFAMETPLLKDENGTYFFEISTQKLKQAHTATANTLSELGAGFNTSMRNAIDETEGTATQKLAATAATGLITGLFELGASMARKGKVENRMVVVRLFPRGNGKLDTEFKRIDYVADQNNRVKEKVMTKCFDSYMLLPHHNSLIYDPDNIVFMSDNGTFVIGTEEMINNMFYNANRFMTITDKKGCNVNVDITKLNRKSITRLIALEYKKCLDPIDPLYKYFPDIDKMTTFTTEHNDYEESSWDNALYDVYLGDWDEKKKDFKSFIIKRHNNDLCVFYSPDQWKTTYVTVYNLFHNSIVTGKYDYRNIADAVILRERNDEFATGTGMPFSKYPCLSF